MPAKPTKLKRRTAATKPTPQPNPPPVTGAISRPASGSQSPSASRSKWVNPLKAKLLSGQRVVGAVITVNSAEIAAHLGGLGFDFLWIDMEHTAVTLEGLRTMVLATRGLPAIPIARPPVNEVWAAKRVLDAGVLGVIFPFTRTPELARQAVAACRYPPVGLRGSGAPLAALRWPEAENYYDFADDNILVIAIVEDVIGLEHVDEIAATPGLDVLYIGTSDLSFSLGLRGEQNHPKLDAAVAKIVAAGKRHGKILGRPSLSPESIERHTAEGYRFFMSQTEWELMAAGARLLLDPLSGGAAQRAAGHGRSTGLAF